MKLLIADDNPFMRRLIRSIIGNYFDEIFECENGFDAVRSFAKNKPDWVLMDIEMPLVDGLTAAQTILKTSPKARIIILSEEKNDCNQRVAKAIGANAFASKDNLLKVRSMIEA